MIRRILSLLLLAGLYILPAATPCYGQVAPQSLTAEPSAAAAKALARGVELFRAGRWADARLSFRQALTLATSAESDLIEEATYYLAATAVELGAEDAEGALRAFAETYPTSVYTNDVYFSLGSYYTSQERWAAAREAFERCNYKALSGPRREQYDLRMGYIEFADGNYEASLRHMERISPRSRYADHARYYRTYVDYAEGRYGAAKEGFQALMKSEAYGDLAPYYLLQIAFREGNYSHVVSEGDALARRAAPEYRAEIERLLAESWFRLEDYPRTLDYLTRFEADGGTLDRDGNYLRGFSLYRTARYAEAVEWLRAACGAEDALTQNASYHLADCYLRAGEKRAAMEAFAMATDERFDKAIAEDALFNYAKLQYESGGGSFNGAINLLKRYVDRYPTSARAAEARTLLIAAYYNSRDYDAAYAAIRSSAEVDSEMQAVLQKITYFRALEAYATGDLATAKRLLAESAAVGVSPKYSSLNTFWQGEIAFAEQNYTVAETKYNAYVRRAPATEREYAFAHYNLGYCAFTRGDRKTATTMLERFLKLRTANDDYRADAYNRLGDIAYADRRYEAATDDYNRAITLGGAPADYARYKRAMTYGVAGQNDRKRQALNEIITLGRGDYVEAAHYELGRSYIEEGRYSDGARQLEQFVSRYPATARTAQAYADLGLAYQNIGNRERALRSYEQVVTLAPRTAEARQALQSIRSLYLDAGDAAGYFAYAERVGESRDLSTLARDSLSFAAAQSLYLGERREAAKRALTSYTQSYPDGAYLTDALYYLSDCHLQDNDTAAALVSLTALSEHGAGPYAVTVYAKLAELHNAAHHPAEAAAAYRQLYEVERVKATREAAMTQYVRQTLLTGDEALIAAMATDVLAHPDAGTVALREARYALAEQHRQAGRMNEALPHYRELAREVRSREGSAAAYYLLEEQYAAGDSQATEEAIFAYSDRQPQPYWLAKAYLLLGEVYLERGDTFQARATWQSVADGYTPQDDGIVAEARQRIQKIK